MIGVIGTNHKLASLEEREAIVRSLSLIGPHVILSTCNRVEVYFVDNPPCHINGYAYYDRDCFLHLARVTAGLDSAVIFETEIQGQVKQAYQQADQLPSELHFLFQKCLKIGKEIRSAIHLCPHMADTESAILRQAREIFGPNFRTLLVGNSQINQAILAKFQDQDVTLINRTPTLSTVPVKPWEHLADWHTYDLIVFATRCPDILLSSLPPLVTPKLVVDLSVPRNVNPNLSHPLLTLINIETLHQTIAAQRQFKAEFLSRLDTYVASRVDRYAENRLLA